MRTFLEYKKERNKFKVVKFIVFFLYLLIVLVVYRYTTNISSVVSFLVFFNSIFISLLTFISSELIGNTLNIYIMDDGVGINEEDKKHIFERFYKGVNSKSNNFGIGLSLAKEIINKDGGVIKLDDSLVGTKFKIKYYIKKY